jgi:molybdopterin converting factor small subunit
VAGDDTVTQSTNSADAWAAGSPAGDSTGQGQVAVTLLFFAEARVAAGTAREEVEGRTVADVLHGARARHGEHFAAVLERARVWVNGDPVDPSHRLAQGDEVAVLPPVSGGADTGWSP